MARDLERLKPDPLADSAVMNDSDSILGLTLEHESSAANTFRLTDRPPVFVSGEGAELITHSGDRFLDFVAGSSTNVLGYGHPAHRDALERSATGGVFHTGTRLPSSFRAKLYEDLTSVLPTGLNCFQLVNSGAEAVEAAIKAAQFATGRHGLIAFEGGYHGRTLGALSVTDNKRIREPFSVLDDRVRFVPYPASETEGPLVRLEQTLQELKPAAMIVEAVQGVSGVRIPPVGFLKQVRNLCTENDVLLIVDEIWNGFGRCGTWFGFNRDDVRPDLVTMGKAMSGSLPLAGVAGPAEILQAWPPGMHTSTFQGNPISCAMASAVIETIRADDLLGHVERAIEPRFRAFAEQLKGAPGIAECRVCGAQIAVSFKKATGAPDADRSTEVQRAGLSAGLLLYGGGIHGECLMLVPPLVISAVQLDRGLRQVLELIQQSNPSG